MNSRMQWDIRSLLLAIALLVIVVFSLGQDAPVVEQGAADLSVSAIESTASESPQGESTENVIVEGPPKPPTFEFLRAQLPMASPRPPEIIPERRAGIPDIILDAKAAFAITQKGQELFAKNPDEALPIASVSKLMTALVALDLLPIEHDISVTSDALRTEGDSAKLVSGDTLSLHDALLALLVPSSNDIASAIAQAAGGNAEFVSAMKEKAALLGLLSASLSNPHGLSPPGNLMSARDVARLLETAMLDPLLLDILKQRNVHVTSKKGSSYDWKTTNALFVYLDGIAAGKTGYTQESQGTLVLAFSPKAILERRPPFPDDPIVLAAVLGSQDRFADTEALVRWVAGAYQW